MKDRGYLTKRLTIALVAVALLLVAAWLPPEERMTRLRVSPGVWPGAEAIVLANVRGQLPAREFQLIELPWSSAAMQALRNGAADVAVMTLDTVLRMRETGQELQVLMVLDESAGADVVFVRDGISDINGLKNKRVGVDVRGVGACLLANALESAGMAMKDVRVVPLVLPEMQQALADGAVDAVVAAEPWSTQFRQTGLRIVYDSRQLSLPIMRVLVASTRACQQLRPQLVTLLKAQMETMPLVTNGAASEDMEQVLRREQLDAEMFRSALARLKPVDAARNKALLCGQPPAIARIADEMAEQMARHGLLEGKPGKGPWIDCSLLKEAAP